MVTCFNFFLNWHDYFINDWRKLKGSGDKSIIRLMHMLYTYLPIKRWEGGGGGLYLSSGSTTTGLEDIMITWIYCMNVINT